MALPVSGRARLVRRSGGRVARALIDPLAATAASQPLTAAYSLRRVVPAYAGACLQVRDVGNALRTLSFRADGSYDAPAASWSGYGDGKTFTVATWYDQSGNGHHLTSSARPTLVFPGAPAHYEGAFVDFTAKSQHLVSATTPLSVGGSANLALLAVTATRGWTSAGTHPRDPAIYATATGPLFGYGTTSAGALVSGADGPGGETTLYGAAGELLVDASTDFANRWRNWWFNHTGATVSGGGDVRTLFTARPHTRAGSANNRLVVGNNGALNQSANASVRELLMFNTGALPDAECARIAAWQRQAWGGLADARFPDRFVAVFAGQSNAQYYAVDGASGDGSAGSNAFTRVFLTDLSARLSIPANPLRELTGYCSSTAIGGSPILKRANPALDKFWWDGDNGVPGPSLNSFLANIDFGAAPGKRYRRCVIMWSQGETDALYWAGNSGDTAVAADWKAQTKLVWAAMRAKIGYDCPILIQPLGNQSGAQAQMEALRVIQTQLAAEVAGVTIAPETTDLARQDSVHFASSLKGPNQSAGGYDLGAARLAAAIAPLFLTMPAR
ncbi:hypothetical protein [Sphingomonas sp. Mn802worker]|uniref:hypothetical protein n=1 Tax=Sphingomonas sp. Mn802worker TaxID=629773 RepID=UPI00037AD233|nr:hypothetical protein [Sphingomonas sp. Mn802worker]